MDDGFYEQAAAGLAVLSFAIALLILVFWDPGPGSRMVPALTLLGLLCLGANVLLGTRGDRRRR